jgi:hypothetical protein
MTVDTRLQSYSVPKVRTVGVRWIKKDGVWWKYWKRDFGVGFWVEMPDYFTSYTVHYTGRPFDE